MRNKTVLFALASLACLGFALNSGTNDAQVIVTGGGAAEFVVEGGGVYGLLSRLQDEEKWETTRDQLVKMAREGKRYEVIFATQSFQKFRGDPILKERTGAVLEGLKEAGLFPITSQDVAIMIKDVRASLAKVEHQAGDGELPNTAIRMLHSCQGTLSQVMDIAKNGEPKAPGAMGGRRIIRRGQ